MNAHDLACVLDVLEQARRLRRFMDGVERAAFDGDEVRQYAVMYVLTLIGEAAARISASGREAQPQVPWRAMAGMRNRLVHEYRSVNLERVWAAATQDVPALVPLLERLAASSPEIDE